ncbi:MAG: hypothetical protein ABI321_24805 [Polyangia bacterium]
MSAPTPARPRLLVVLAVIGFLYGTLGIVTSLSSFVTLTGSHDAFTAEVKRQADKLVPQAEAGKPTDELATVALRKAEALWTRRGVLLPLAGGNLIVSVLILLGCSRIWSADDPRGRRAWARSAWQLGCLVGLPLLGLQTLVEIAHAKDLAAAVTDLTGPFATSLKDVALSSAVVWMRTSIVATYLLGAAAYLNGPAVRTFTAEV